MFFKNPFRKTKTRQQELDEICDKLVLLVGTFRKIGYYPPESFAGICKLADDIGKMQKELDEEKEFTARYYHR